MYKKILVTGGTALIGSAIKAVQNDYPKSEFIFIGSKDCDLTQKQTTLDFIGKLQPDAIIHLAAISGGIGLSMKYQAAMLRDNILMNIYILEAARIHNIKKIVMRSKKPLKILDNPYLLFPYSLFL